VCIGNYLGEDILRTHAAPCLRVFFLFSTVSPAFSRFHSPFLSLSLSLRAFLFCFVPSVCSYCGELLPTFAAEISRSRD